MHLLLTSKMLPDVESYNVVGDLKGSEHPEQVVIVSGHLDSWDLGTGAIDDAAGVAVAMETAHAEAPAPAARAHDTHCGWMVEETVIFGGSVRQAHVAETANHSPQSRRTWARTPGRLRATLRDGSTSACSSRCGRAAGSRGGNLGVRRNGTGDATPLRS